MPPRSARAERARPCRCGAWQVLYATRRWNDPYLFATEQKWLRPPPASADQSADRFARNDPLDVALLHDIENDDRQLIVHTQGNSRGIHDFESPVQDFDVSQLRELLGPLMPERVRVKDPFHFGGLENHLSADFHGPEAGGGIGGKIRIARAAGEDHHAPFF